MTGRLLFFTVLCQIALAFSDTHPLVAWSSHSSNTLEHLPLTLSTSAHAASVLDSIFLDGRLCDHDAIVLIDQPGLHASDLRTLPPSSALARTIASAHVSRQFPYVRSSPFSVFGQSVSDRCNSLLVNFALGKGRLTLDPSSKHVVCMSFPHLGGTVSSRKIVMAEHESRISDELDAIASMFPKHLVILTGSPSLSKRHSVDTSSPALLNVFDIHGNFDAGILSRYQLLTPGLISTILITFFLLVPIVLIGISALAGIQSPLRVEAPKGYNAQDKKNE